MIRNNQKKTHRSQIIPNLLLKPNRTKKQYIHDENFKGHIRKTTKNFRYSIWKLNESVKPIRGLFLEDAEKILDKDNSKGAKLIKLQLHEFKLQEPTLFPDYRGNVIKRKPHDNSQIELPDFHLRIKSAIVGSKLGHRLPVFRAKGRVTYNIRKESSLRLHFEEVPIQTICENMVKGEVPRFIRHKIRERLYKKSAPLEEVESLSFVSTYKGLRDRKSVYNRIIRGIREKYALKNNIVLNKNIIKNQILSEMGGKLVPLYKAYLGTSNKIPSSVFYSKSLNDKVEEENKKKEENDRLNAETDNIYEDGTSISEKNMDDIQKRFEKFSDN